MDETKKKIAGSLIQGMKSRSLPREASFMLHRLSKVVCLLKAFCFDVSRLIPLALSLFLFHLKKLQRSTVKLG